MMFSNRAPDGWLGEHVFRPWTIEDFQRDPSFGITLRSILATLERHAIIETWSTDYQNRVNLLRRQASESSIPDPIRKWIEEGEWTKEAQQLGLAWVLSELGVRIHNYLLETAASLRLTIR
jgi:hypothetical protein